MIVIKLNDVPDTKESLKKRTSRAWKTRLERLQNQKELICLHKGKILAAYKVLSYAPDKQDPKRVEFELEEISSELVGRKLVYKTGYPCTIVDKEKLVFA